MTIVERLDALKPLLGEKGMQDMADAVAAYRAQYGKPWLAEFKRNNPALTDLMDLIANYEFDEAWQRLFTLVDEWIDTEPGIGKRIAYRAAANVTLGGARPEIAKLHAMVRAEIDR